MKNIHVLPTDKPSRLWVNNLLQGKLELSKDVLLGSNTAQHIYITNSEDIKEGDWVYAKIPNIVFQTDKHTNFAYANLTNNVLKIILTTDGELIKDGVQAIDDEFLEWYVNNPGCDEIEIDKNWNYPLDKSWEYKIRIPQELPIVNGSYGCTIQTKRQETLEELVDRLSNKKAKELGIFLQGVKWQREQDKNKYSEEEVLSILNKMFEWYIDDTPYHFNLTMLKNKFEQFKKK